MPRLWRPLSGSLTIVAPEHTNAPASSSLWVVMGSTERSAWSPVRTTSWTGAADASWVGIGSASRSAERWIASQTDGWPIAIAHRSYVPKTLMTGGSFEPRTRRNSTIGNLPRRSRLASRPVTSKRGSTSRSTTPKSSGHRARASSRNVRRFCGRLDPVGACAARAAGVAVAMANSLQLRAIGGQDRPALEPLDVPDKAVLLLGAVAGSGRDVGDPGLDLGHDEREPAPVHRRVGRRRELLDGADRAGAADPAGLGDRREVGAAARRGDVVTDA